MIKSPLDTFEEKLPKTQELIQNIIEKLGMQIPILLNLLTIIIIIFQRSPRLTCKKN